MSAASPIRHSRAILPCSTPGMKTTDLAPTRLPDHLRETQRLLFIAKHARWTGGLHPDDGNHAPYHREMRETLESLGIALSIAARYAALFDRPLAAFVFPLLTPGGCRYEDRRVGKECV